MFKKDQTPENQKRTTQRNIIGNKTSIVGDIKSDGDFRIDGTLEGNLITEGRVVIGSEGFIKGTVVCVNADIEGRFSGELRVSKTLTIKSTANISGDVVIGKLSVEPGASFNATCSMKGAVKELKNEQKEIAEATA